jgi:peroxiredoxin
LTPSPSDLKRANSVLEFQQPVPGIFVPRTIRETMSWAPGIVVETVIQEAAVNVPMADADLTFRFPAGISIADTARGVWYAWGNEAPARTYKTADELTEWTRYQINPGTVPSGGRSSVPERYEALAKEYVTRYQTFGESYRAARTEAERRNVARQLQPDAAEYAVRCLELAKEDPGTPAALHVLARAATLNGSRVSGEALDLLRKHWADRPAVAEVVLPVGLSVSFSPETEPLLRDVLARNPSRDARAHAACALASLLFSIADLSRWYAQGPAAAAGLERHYGKHLDRLLARAPIELLREAEGLMTRIASEDADIKLHPAQPRNTQTLGRLALAWLRLDDEPLLGRPAPAIEGTDLNGKPLRLGDYRGKVVVVVFWASWCRPCMNMIPGEKALLRRLTDKPFALLGVNCDAAPADARDVAAAESIPWPNCHDGVPGEGKIAERYRVAGRGIPAIFVIDREGVLRYKWLSSSSELDQAVNALLAEGDRVRNGG